MKSYLLLLGIATILVALPVFATGSISITSISIPTSATQGASFTITMSVSGSQVSSVTGSLTLPTGVTCTSSTQDISLDASGTGTATWSCSASVSGDYSNRITVSVTAKDSGTGGSLSDSQQTGLTVMSPASLTVSSSSLSATSITAGNMVNFDAGVNNIGDTSTSYTITFSSNQSGVSFSPTSVSSTNIDGSSLKTHNIVVTGSSAGSYALAATVSGNGQTLTITKTLTVIAVSSSQQNTSSSFGGSGSGSNTSTQPMSKIVILMLPAGRTQAIDYGLSNNATTLQRISFTVTEAVSNIEFDINKNTVKPSSVPMPSAGIVYGYVTISMQNITDSQISSATIDFNVTKLWISANNIDKNSVALYRYSSGWTKLAMTLMGEDSDQIMYRADSPGLSVFAIGGSVATTPSNQSSNVNQTGNNQTQDNTTENQTGQTIANNTMLGNDISAAVINGSIDMIIMIIIAAVIIVAGAGIGTYYFMRGRKKSKPKPEQSKN